jgi:hypothetical protein
MDTLRTESEATADIGGYWCWLFCVLTEYTYEFQSSINP